MKKILILISLFFSFYSIVLASEEVHLNVDNINKLSIPDDKINLYPRIQHEVSEKDNGISDLYVDNDVFDSKFGKAFTNVINKTLINNKSSNIFIDN